MKVIKPSIEILSKESYEDMLELIELAGRTCYKSEDNITDDSAEGFIKSLMNKNHKSVLEHAKVTLRVICDRGVSHEIVRHRMASYSQESTRYCNYSKNKFGNEITVIKPCFLEENTEKYDLWLKTCENCEKSYFEMLNMGMTPQEARDILPNSLKTEIVMSLNISSWRNFLELRNSKAAHPQMREVASMIYDEFEQKYPIFVYGISKGE